MTALHRPRFCSDPSKFPDFIHTQKRNPATNCKDPDAFWDFISLVPETIHQVTVLFSDRGTAELNHLHAATPSPNPHPLVVCVCVGIQALRLRTAT